MGDYNSVFILEKILQSRISSSGSLQGLETSRSAHTRAAHTPPHLLSANTNSNYSWLRQAPKEAGSCLEKKKKKKKKGTN